MKTKHCGPICLHVDDQAERVTFTVNRSPRKADRLGAGNMARVASWALSVAEQTSYTVDTTPIEHLLESGDSVGV